MRRPSGIDLRSRRQAGQATADDKRVMKETVTRVKTKIAPNERHTLTLTTAGDRLSVSIDGKPIGELKSPGIARPKKRTVRLAVTSEAWVDDFKFTAAE